jgi:signal recognition particle receptor subunit beta
MVFFNYATMQMAAKIVYYGPGLCGKTTNLHHIYSKTSPQSRGEMVSLETETDRTLFFDLLPIDVGVIGGFKTRLQLYTVPGQVFYNTTRKLVLKGVDGIVFVADSQKAMLDANGESFRNLRENLAEIGLDLDEIPLVVQLNKRDLPMIATVNEMLNVLDPDRRHEHIESVASTGTGVFETLKLISKLTLRTLRRRMTGEEPVKAAPAARTAQFRVKEDTPAPPPSRTVPQSDRAKTGPIPAFGGNVATPSPIASGQAAASTTVVEPATQVKPPEIEEPVEELTAEDVFTESPLAKTANVDTRILADAPVDEPPPSTQYIPPPSLARATEPEIAAPPPAPPPAPEPEINFAQTEKPVKAPEPKHVKVRSSVDIMAELEALRKRATTAQPATPKPKKDTYSGNIAIPKPKRDVHRTVSLQMPPDVAPRTKNVRVTVSFEGDDGVVKSEEQSIELNDASEVRSLNLDVKIALD